MVISAYAKQYTSDTPFTDTFWSMSKHAKSPLDYMSTTPLQQLLNPLTALNGRHPPPPPFSPPNPESQVVFILHNPWNTVVCFPATSCF